LLRARKEFLRVGKEFLRARKEFLRARKEFLRARRLGWHKISRNTSTNMKRMSRFSTLATIACYMKSRI
jgi:hypothetical protein